MERVGTEQGGTSQLSRRSVYKFRQVQGEATSRLGKARLYTSSVGALPPAEATPLGGFYLRRFAALTGSTGGNAPLASAHV